MEGNFKYGLYDKSKVTPGYFGKPKESSSDDRLRDLGLLAQEPIESTGLISDIRKANEPTFIDSIKDSAGTLKSAIGEIGSELNVGLKEFGADISKIQTGRSDEGQGLLGRTVQNFSDAQKGIKDARVSQEMGNQGGFASMMQSMGLLAGATSETIGDTFISALETLAPEELEKAVVDGIQSLAETEGGQYVQEQIKKAEEGYQYLLETDPDKARAYKGLFGALSLGGDVAGAGTITKGTKGVVKGVENIGKGIEEGIESTKNFTKAKVEDVEKVVENIRAVTGEKLTETGENIGEKATNARNYIAGLEERDVFALKNTPKEEWDEVIDQAKDAKLSPEADYKQTPYHIGAEKASEAFNQLEDNLSVNQKSRVETLKNSGVESIDTAQVRSDIVQDIRETFNVDTITTNDGKVQFNPTEGRKSLLDESNPRDLEAIKLLEESTRVSTPLEMMDTIRKLQNIIYDSNVLNSTSKGMKQFVERSVGKLNAEFKKQVGDEYSNILDEMAQDIKLKNDLDSVFKAGADEIGNRGELAMKRIASGTTTSSDVRNLALKIKERLGIDLIKEARLRQLAMDIVGDTRAGTLFQTIKAGRQGIFDKIIESILDATPLSKEKTALKRAGTGLNNNTTKNADTNIDSTTLSNTGNKEITTTDSIPSNDGGFDSSNMDLK